MRRLFPVLLLIASAPQAPTQLSAPAPIERRLPSDLDLDIAANLTGKALFLRCFCAAGSLSFTAAGEPKSPGEGTPVDWTLSGVNIQKVERRSPTQIVLEGVRVAVRFAPDRREWDRHPQKDEKIHLTLQDPGDPAVFRRGLAAIFSLGIDRALQRSTPPYWQHFFDPQTPWPPDELTGVTIYVPGKPDAAGQTATAPVPSHKTEAQYSPAAQRDNVRGTVGLQFVVAADGTPHRIVVTDPVGYGLDAEAAEAIAKFRFTPATLGGVPVAAQVRVRQEFVLVAGPR